MTDQDTFDQLMQPYRNDMDRVALTPDAKERLVSALLAKDSTVQPEPVFSDGEMTAHAQAARVDGAASQCESSAPGHAAAAGDNLRVIRRFPRRARVAAALIAAALVVLTGFTVAAQGQEYWRQWFGTDGVAEYVASVQKSATDQGITMEVVSAVSDANHAYFLLQVTGVPEKGSGENSEVFPGSLYIGGEPSWWDGRLIAVEPVDGSFNYMIISGEPVEAGEEVAFTFEGLKEQDTRFDEVVGDGPVSNLLKSEEGSYRAKPNPAMRVERGEIGEWSSSMACRIFSPEKGGLALIKEVFAGKNMDAVVSPEGNISVVGIDCRDGVLHVLTEYSGSYITGSAQPYLVNPPTGEEMVAEYSISYFYGEDFDVAGEKGGLDSNQPTHLYQDSAFYLQNEEALNLMQLRVRGSSFSWDVKGEWDLNFPMPSSAPFKLLSAYVSVPCQGFGHIGHVAVTPFSIGFDVSDVGEAFWEHQPNVKIVYSDGTTVDYPGSFQDETWESESQLEVGNVTISAIGLVENYEDIAALIVNGARVDLS